MTKRAKTARGREKPLEKEIPCRMVPPELHERFRQAELKQWGEHVKYDAMVPMSVEESRKTLAERTESFLRASRTRTSHGPKASETLPWTGNLRLVS